MTEKLFTGTLNKNQNKNKTKLQLDVVPCGCYEMDKTNISMFEILEPGGQLWAIQHHRSLNFIELGYLHFTATLT